MSTFLLICFQCVFKLLLIGSQSVYQWHFTNISFLLQFIPCLQMSINNLIRFKERTFYDSKTPYLFSWEEEMKKYGQWNQMYSHFHLFFFFHIYSSSRLTASICFLLTLGFHIIFLQNDIKVLKDNMEIKQMLTAGWACYQIYIDIISTPFSID